MSISICAWPIFSLPAQSNRPHRSQCASRSGAQSWCSASSSTRFTIRRRTWGLLIRMNALTSASPSRVVMRSVNGSDEGSRPGRASPAGAPSKKNAIDTCRIWQACCSRTRADAVRAFLIFLDLLERDAERIAELRLAHVQHHTAHTQATANMLVYGVGRLLAGHRFFSQESEHRSIMDTRLILVAPLCRVRR